MKHPATSAGTNEHNIHVSQCPRQVVAARRLPRMGTRAALRIQGSMQESTGPTQVWWRRRVHASPSLQTLKTASCQQLLVLLVCAAETSDTILIMNETLNAPLFVRSSVKNTSWQHGATQRNHTEQQVYAASAVMCAAQSSHGSTAAHGTQWSLPPARRNDTQKRRTARPPVKVDPPKHGRSFVTKGELDVNGSGSAPSMVERTAPPVVFGIKPT